MTGFLIFIGSILIILNVLSIKKQSKSFKGVLGNAIEDTKEYDIKIGELRREFSESILELQSELVEIKEITSYLEKANDIEDRNKFHDKNKEKFIIEEVYDNNTNTDNNKNNSAKVDEIKKLFSEGSSVEEISEIMHLGKGEVLLIKDLYTR